MNYLDLLLSLRVPLLGLVLPWFALIILNLGRDWPVIAPALFADKGCDEDRERHRWRKEQTLSMMACWISAMLLLFLYVVNP